MTPSDRQTVIDALEGISDDDIICRASHHPKKDQHAAFEPCPVAARFKDALAIMRREVDVDVEAATKRVVSHRMTRAYVNGHCVYEAPED